jgi:hypothetical protein
MKSETEGERNNLQYYLSFLASGLRVRGMEGQVVTAACLSTTVQCEQYKTVMSTAATQKSHHEPRKGLDTKTD